MAMEKGAVFAHKSMEDYEQAIIEEHGILSSVARRLNIRRQSVVSKIKNHPHLQTLVNEERDGLIDDAENVLYRCMKKDSIPAAIYILKTIGAARGWGEKQNITINKGRDENDYDLSRLTEEEIEQLDKLTAKIYKADVIEAETS